MQTAQFIEASVRNAGALDTGLLIARLVFGLTLSAHGAQKLFGWFGGDSLTSTGRVLRAAWLPTGPSVRGDRRTDGDRRRSADHVRLAGLRDIISDILTADTIPHRLKGEMIDQQLDKLQDPSRDVISMDEWRMMADHLGGVELMGGRATELVRAVQAPSDPLAADRDPLNHDTAQTDRPMKGVVADTMPHAGAKPGVPERPRTPAPEHSAPHRH